MFTTSGNDMKKCVTFHLYFFVFTMRKYVRSLLTNLFLFFCLSFLLVWWLFSDQQYHFTWKTRPTSVHCFHHHSSLSVLWHPVYIFLAQPPYNHNISMSAFHQVSSHKADSVSIQPQHQYVRVPSSILTQSRLVEK